MYRSSHVDRNQSESSQTIALGVVALIFGYLAMRDRCLDDFNPSNAIYTGLSGALNVFYSQCFA